MGRDLKGLLKEWQVPDPPPQLDARIAATFLEARRRYTSVWMRPVRLPLPVFALLLLLQLGSVAAVGHYLVSPGPPPPVLSMPERLVEVPVVSERTITYVLYLPAGAAGDPRQRASQSVIEQANTNLPVDLTGYQPVSEPQLHVIKGEEKNER